MAIEDRIAAGEDPESARLAAMKDFGNVLQTVESTRDVWRGRGVSMLVDLWQDARFGGRMLINNPAFSLTVMTVLALGIAGNVTVFTMFKGLALDPLPGVTASSDLAVVLNRMPTGRVISVSIPDFRYFQQHSHSFTNLTASAMLFATVGRGTDSQRVAAELLERINAQLVRHRFQLALRPGRPQHSLGEHLAMIETMAIYCLVIALLLLFANPFA